MADSLLPVIERIVRNIVETLEGVSDAAGYATTLSAVERPKPALGNRNRDQLAVVVQGKPKQVTADENEGPGAYNFVTWEQPIAVVLTVVESEASDVSIDERLNLIRSDVERAIMIDAHRGGLALDTRIEDPEYPDPETLQSNQGEVWAIFTVHYRTRYDDPYTQE